jgi:phosphatidylserine/phosphatidylglycerophosphate/cardiolipin synthase-like enzyme
VFLLIKYLVEDKLTLFFREDHRVSWRRWGALLLACILVSCDFLPLNTTQVPLQSSVTPYADLFRPTEGELPIQVYFTCGTQSDCDRNELLDLVLADIANAKVSVHVAMYNINLTGVSQALIDAMERGVEVELVTETDNMDGAQVQNMLRSGLPIVGDDGDGLMHDKFLVIDSAIVWTGSMNMTETSVYSDDNNFERIDSETAAIDYEIEFEEMFVDHQFGEESAANTPFAQFEMQGIPVQVYFSPDDNVQEHLLQLVDDARVSVYFLAYTLTQDDLTNTLVEASHRGVDVRGVCETDKVGDSGADYLVLKAAGIDVRLDSNPAAMHDKVLIIDDQIIVFGSYNFTSSAEHWNDENVMIVSDTELTGKFLAEFERIFADATP